MTERCIYLDESGDLGWSFDRPYRSGGSSRYLTIACLSIDPAQAKLGVRLIRDLYHHFDWPRREEKKWARMSADERLEFAIRSKALHQKLGESISYHSITVSKAKVREHIRADPNKLYNWMIARLLLNEMAKHEAVTFVPDPRSIKVESGSSLHDYLQTELWMDMNVPCKLTTKPCDSSQSPNVQFSDMLSGMVQNHYEDQKSAPMLAIRPCIKNQTLFF